jgi:hypothetical protein
MGRLDSHRPNYCQMVCWEISNTVCRHIWIFLKIGQKYLFTVTELVIKLTILWLLWLSLFIHSNCFRGHLLCQVYTFSNGQEDWTRYPYPFKHDKVRFSHVSVQLSSITERVLLFGRFPGFDHLSFWQEQHVDDESAGLVERYWHQNTRRDSCLSVTLSTTNLTWTDLRSNSGPRGLNTKINRNRI